jgi:hypothetical protein
MRLLVASVVIAVAAIGAAPIAAADDVPGIDDDAILGAPCDNWDGTSSGAVRGVSRLRVWRLVATKASGCAPRR